MKKILSVAFNEYRNVVFTASFAIGLLFPVILYGGMFLLFIFIDGTGDLDDRKIVIVDRTGQLELPLTAAAQERNRSTDVYDDGEQKEPEFVPEFLDAEERTNREVIDDLSVQVAEDEIFAFAIIGPDYVAVEGGDGDYVRYYSDSPTYTDLPRWLNRSLRDAVEEIRFSVAGLDEREINQIVSHIGMERFRVSGLDDEGDAEAPTAENEAVTLVIAFAFVMMVYIGSFMVMPILLNSVIEEKMQRIAEVLLASVSPFQLLSGKLLAGVLVGLTFCVVYLASGVLSLRYFEYLGFLPTTAIPFFFVFLICALLTFGALFGAVSSACQDLKDSQNLSGPIVIVLVIPMMMSFVLVNSPDSTFATIISLIPGFSPMTMMARLAIPPGPPLWQVWLAVGLNIALAIGVVWAASRVFRIGILSQGKAPSWRELATWVFRA